MPENNNAQTDVDPIKVYQNSQIHYFDGLKNLGKFCKLCLSGVSNVCEHASKVGGSPLK